MDFLAQLGASIDILLDTYIDTDNAQSSTTATYEVEAEQFSFTTARDNQWVMFNVVIPMTCHRVVDGTNNAAVRVYLDGTAVVPVGSGGQWNGTLLFNGGQWSFQSNFPLDGRCSGTMMYKIPTAGAHTLTTCISGSVVGANPTIGTLRARRRYQVIGF